MAAMGTAIESQSTYFADILFILASFIHVDVVGSSVCAATRESLLQYHLVYRAMCRGNRRFTHLTDYTFEYDCSCSQFNAIQMMHNEVIGLAKLLTS